MPLRSKVVAVYLSTVFATAVLASPADEIDRIKALPLGERGAAVEALAGKGTPIVDGKETVFLARSRDQIEPRLVGDFNGWGRYPNEEGLLGGRMQRLPGADWWYLEAQFPFDARLEYGFEYGGRQPEVDPGNRHSVTTFGKRVSVVEMPGWVPSRWVKNDADHRLLGKLVSSTMPGRVAEGDHKVHVYLPPGYPADAPYPVVYVNDGSLYVEGLRMHTIVDRLIAGGAMKPVIAVFADPIDRRTEYMGSSELLEFFRDVLVPAIDEKYQTDPRPDARTVIGGSRGALAALILAFDGEPLVGHCGLLEPAISPSLILESIDGAQTRPLDFQIVGGNFDLRFVGDAHQVVDRLRWKGYAVRADFEPFGHTPNSWKHSIPVILTRLFSDSPGLDSFHEGESRK